MRSTNQPLTDRELIYAKNQFKIIQYKNKLTWIIPAVLACLSLLGFLLVEGQTLLFGILMLAFAIIGVFFFIRKTYRTTFNLLPTGQMMKGILNLRFIGSREHGQNYLFIDDHKLETPAGLENYCSDLVEKYKNQLVNVTLAVLEEKKGPELKANHYSLLKIEHDFCIESAFKNHPTQFSKKLSTQTYFSIILILLFFFCVPLLIIFVLDFSDNLLLGPLVLSMILALSAVLMLQQKFFPMDDDTEEMELKEILKCTCM
jgi:hypothetical protein